jgi:RNA polymerase sigma factor (sigma-70 family)
MSKAITTRDRNWAFPNTRWSVVLAAAGEPSVRAEAALEAICRSYWHPLYAYARRAGCSPHDAQDLTQEFFRHFLEKRWVKAADRNKGRLRTFLITALKRFMANEWRRVSAQRRGGALPHLAIDTRFAESAGALDHTQRGPEEEFDRQWALTLLNLAVTRLADEFAAAGKAAEFQALKGCLTTAHRTLSYAEAAARLGSTEGAARVAVHRLRKRFREVFREEIAQTLAPDADLDMEVRHLAASLAGA